jgi:hypothetical protein
MRFFSRIRISKIELLARWDSFDGFVNGLAGSPDSTGLSASRDALCSARIESRVDAQDSRCAIPTICGGAKGRTLPMAAHGRTPTMFPQRAVKKAAPPLPRNQKNCGI